MTNWVDSGLICEGSFAFIALVSHTWTHTKAALNCGEHADNIYRNRTKKTGKLFLVWLTSLVEGAGLMFLWSSRFIPVLRAGSSGGVSTSAWLAWWNTSQCWFPWSGESLDINYLKSRNHKQNQQVIKGDLTPVRPDLWTPSGEQTLINQTDSWR